MTTICWCSSVTISSVVMDGADIIRHPQPSQTPQYWAVFLVYSRYIGQVTRKIIYSHYKISYAQHHSIPKTFHSILKTKSLELNWESITPHDDKRVERYKTQHAKRVVAFMDTVIKETYSVSRHSWYFLGVTWPKERSCVSDALCQWIAFDRFIG